MLLHLQPLYRRGPNWSMRIDSAEWPPSTPFASSYGPPTPHDVLPSFQRVHEFDCRMFALYFLITESLATYVGYRIVQHCLNSRQVVKVLPSSVRLWIVLSYCAMKIRLIDYAFHGSLYMFVSMLLAFCFAISALIGIAFHFGPLHFLFMDTATRRQRARAAASMRPLCFDYVLEEVKHFLIKLHFHEYVLMITGRRPLEDLSPVAEAVGDAPTRARVPFLFTSVELDVRTWNAWITSHSLASVLQAARKKMKPSLINDGILESRFLVLMLSNGLLIDTVFKSPTPSMVHRMPAYQLYPVELVIRFVIINGGSCDCVSAVSGSKTSRASRNHTPSSSSSSSSRPLTKRAKSSSSTPTTAPPVFLYADCPKLVGPLAPAQKMAILLLLQFLNASSGRHVDVPLRSLRCKNFTEARCHENQASRRSKGASDSISSHLESVFG